MSVTSITGRLPRVEDRLLLQKQIVENLPSAILVFDLETLVLVDHNAAAMEFFERVPSQRGFRDLIGRTAAEIFPAFEETLASLFRQAVATGNPQTVDKWALAEAGERETFAAVMVKPMNAAGEITHLMVSLIDITEKIAARERQQYLQRMESVGTLAGGLAHDVNNVLAVIVGNAHILRSSVPATPEAEESLAAIEEAAERARRLTGKLLTFAKGGSSDRQPIGLNDAIGETIRLLARSLGEEIRIETDLAAELPPVSAEIGGIQQVLLNLLVNARDAMDGRGNLKIRTAREDGWIVLEVSDSGPGIPEAIRPYIFDPFFTTKKERGTGLGLSVVYGLIKSYGGSVSACGAPAGGALFRILLPACD